MTFRSLLSTRWRKVEADVFYPQQNRSKLLSAKAEFHLDKQLPENISAARSNKSEEMSRAVCSKWPNSSTAVHCWYVLRWTYSSGSSRTSQRKRLFPAFSPQQRKEDCTLAFFLGGRTFDLHLLKSKQMDFVQNLSSWMENMQSSVIISRRRFKWACVAGAPRLRESSSWVKQGLIVNLEHPGLLVWFQCIRGCWVSSLCLLPSPTLSGIRVTKRPPTHTVAGTVWSLPAETQGGVSTNLL